MTIITSPRGTRASWDEGQFDALVMAAYTMGGGQPLSNDDRTIITVGALKFWQHNSIPTMVGRVLTIEDTITLGGFGTAIAMLRERDLDRHLTDVMFRPILFASTLRDYDKVEIERLIEAVESVGVEARMFGLRG